MKSITSRSLLRPFGWCVVLLVLGSVLSGCAIAMSMTASQFYTEFPRATSTRYLTNAEAISTMQNGSCRAIDNHTYNAPIGVSVGEDVRNGAEGVDQIVKNYGGNAYRITEFGWATVRDDGTTQLGLKFTSLLCDG